MVPGSHYLLAADLTEFERYDDYFSTIKEQCPVGLSGMVHYSGHRITKPVRIQRVADLKALFDIHVIAFVELVRHVTKKHIVSQNGCSIVGVSSVASIRGAKAMSGYAAAKGAINSLIASLALEYADRNVRINGVLPGHVDTEMNKHLSASLSERSLQSIVRAHPLGLGNPADVSALVVFLLSDQSRWMTGANIPIDGGFLIHE